MDLLRPIQSLLKLPDDPDCPVLPFHKSFPDFFTDPTSLFQRKVSHLPQDRPSQTRSELTQTLTRIGSLSCRLDSCFGTFSPATHHISVSATRGRDSGDALLVLEVRNSGCVARNRFLLTLQLLSRWKRLHSFLQGQPAYLEMEFRSLIRRREFQQSPSTLQFSLTLSSVLGHTSKYSSPCNTFGLFSHSSRR